MELLNSVGCVMSQKRSVKFVQSTRGVTSAIAVSVYLDKCTLCVSMSDTLDWNALIQEAQRILTQGSTAQTLYEAEQMSDVELLLEDAERLLEELEELD